MPTLLYLVEGNGKEAGEGERKKNGRKEENEKIEENKVATIFIHVRPMKLHSKMTSVGLRSHATCNETRFCFVNSGF